MKYIRVDFGYEDPLLDNSLDHDDDDDDEEQEVDTTRPFQPGAASTPYQPGAPYHGGEQTEMQTMHHERSTLPDTSYQEETPLLERTPSIGALQKESKLRQKLKKAVYEIKKNSLIQTLKKSESREALEKMREKLLLWGQIRVSTRF